MGEEDFLRRGFISDVAKQLPAFVRSRSQESFALADDISDALLQIAQRSADKTRSTSMSPEVLCTLLLFRSISAIQGAILSVERGMVVEARILIRSTIENAFCLAAIHSDQKKFQEMLQLDDGGARRSILKLALEVQALAERPDLEDRIRKTLEQIDSGAKVFSVKALSEMGALRRQYFFYRLLSNDAAHPSATSLLRHLEHDRAGASWSAFKFGPATSVEVEDTLRLLAINGLAVGIAFTDFVKDFEGNARIAELSERSDQLAKNSASA